MLRSVRLLFLAVLVAATAGCSKFVLDARSMNEVVSMTANTGAPGSGDATGFKVSTKAAYLGLVANLVTLKKPDVPLVLQSELHARGGTAIRNLTIDKRMTFLDGLVSFVTLGIYNQETITLEGEIVKESP